MSLKESARPSLWHLCLIVLIICLVWAGIGLSLVRERDVVALDAAKDTANLALAFEEDIARTIDFVDQALLFLREAYKNDGSTALLSRWARSRAFLDNLQVQMALSDRNGNVVWSNLGPVAAGVDLADRDHFLAQKVSSDDNLYIGRPVIDRVSGKRTIQFARKLLTADGAFDGIAIVSLDPAYLSRIYGSLALGNGSVLLATTGGTIMARAPDAAGTIGTELSAETRARMLQGLTNSGFRAVSGIDGVERIFSSRRVERYPLVLAVGLAIDDVFAAYRRNQRFYFAAGILLSCACLVVGLAMLHQRRSLVASRHALSVTLENMSQGIAMIRRDGSVPVFNQRAVELLGLPADLVRGRVDFRRIVAWQNLNNEFDGLDPEGLARKAATQGVAGHRGDYTYERVRPDGSVLEVRTLALPDGAIVRTFTDISERKRHEAALLSAQTRADHAERMQALGQLAGGIAHDFNNILQAVQGCASLIQARAADPASARRFAQMILDAIGRGTSITRRLLAFARRGELQAEAVHPDELLRGLRDVFSHTLGAGIEVTVRLEPDLPPLLADKGQLETVLVNLATNARDAMPDGGVLTLAAAEETVPSDANHPAELRPGQYVRLSIIDTGVGMDERTLARVLEPFFSTKPPGQGTGLGLSMAQGFVEQSGGGLIVGSRLGEGTTVQLWLPASVQRGPQPLAVASPPTPEHEIGRRILLVDDEAVVRNTLAESLEAAGYTVTPAADGAEGLKLLELAMAVDVLVTDLSMPGIDGLAVIRQAQRQRPGLPAVLLTGYAGHGAQLAVGETVSGAFVLVRKPVTAAQLADRIEALLAVPSTP